MKYNSKLFTIKLLNSFSGAPVCKEILQYEINRKLFLCDKSREILPSLLFSVLTVHVQNKET